MLSKWINAWTGWLGDRDLELAIRRELARQQFASTTARIRRSRLEAIERPGWVQVWSFTVDTTQASRPVELFGAARDDGREHGRRGTVVFLSGESNERNRQLAEWCEGRIRRVDRGLR